MDSTYGFLNAVFVFVLTLIGFKMKTMYEENSTRDNRLNELEARMRVSETRIDSTNETIVRFENGQNILIEDVKEILKTINK